MAQKAVILLGHSHLGAILDALHRRPLPETPVEEHHYYFHDVWAHNTQYADSDGKGGVVFNGQVLNNIKHIVPPKLEHVYVTFFGGNGHVVLALSKHPCPFDFVLPEHPDLPLELGAELVPCGYLSRLLLDQMGPYAWQLVALRQAISGKIYCVETPPPCGDDEYLCTHLGSYIPDPRNIIGAALRWKMWRLHSRLLRDICDANNIEFVPVPNNVCDSRGFLAPEAFGEDATHGNAWYGEQLLCRLDLLIGSHYGGWTRFT